MTSRDPGERGVASGRQLLECVLTRTDHLAVDDFGSLVIERCRSADLIERYGSPLFVISESTLRANARRVMDAFSSRWPTDVNVMFAIKANNNLAVRRIMSDVGLGGDCFSEGEIYATLAGGADPTRVALNGSNKAPAALAEAVRHGMVINLDSREELSLVEKVASSLSRQARVTVRLRLSGEDYDLARAADPSLPDLRHFIDTEQVGSSLDVVQDLLQRALASESVNVLGYHFHLGRLSRLPAYHRWWSAGVATSVCQLLQRTGFAPAVVNIGGGYAREREPERGDAPLMNPHSIEDYAETVTTQLRQVFESEELDVPQLWLEPGRYLAGNAGVLLATVGTVKSDVGMTWLNVDASINDLPRVDNARWDYVLLPASAMDELAALTADVVGSLCVGRHLKVGALLPELQRGDVVAFLDTGAYSETASTQYNAVPRPATVLVRDDQSWVIKRRETVRDLFERHEVPDHLREPATELSTP